MEPKIPIKRRGPLTKTCTKCGIEKTIDSFIQTRSWFYEDGLIPICNSCVKEQLNDYNWEWAAVDKFCQMIDIPFIPKQFTQMQENAHEDVMPIYARFFLQSQYEEFGWHDYYEKFKELKNKKKIDMELPLINNDYYADLELRWGSNYDHEELVYLENLYNGLLSTQNVNGALQMDQAQKLCKISLQIDNRIRADVDFDKLMSTYEKMVKAADFTPKNAKSDSDFSSFGEVQAWLEKRGWINTYYDDANKDIVDEVIHSNQAFVQRLYTNETGLSEEIKERIEMLKAAAELDQKDTALEQKRLAEDFFDIKEVDLDQHDNEAYNELIVDDVLDTDTVGV